MIVAIVPAAGLSRRMGASKLLLPFAGTTVIGHIADELLRSRVDEVCVVVGHESDRVREALAGRTVRIVANPNFQQTDMLTSIRFGLAAMRTNCRAVLVALADQPAITAELVDSIIDAYDRSAGGIVVPTHAGRRGHPLLVAGRFRDEILAGYDRVGLRGLLSAHADDVFELPVADPAVLSNMNHPTDYERELARRKGL